MEKEEEPYTTIGYVYRRKSAIHALYRSVYSYGNEQHIYPLSFFSFGFAMRSHTRYGGTPPMSDVYICV